MDTINEKARMLIFYQLLTSLFACDRNLDFAQMYRFLELQKISDFPRKRILIPERQDPTLGEIGPALYRDGTFNPYPLSEQAILHCLE